MTASAHHPRPSRAARTATGKAQTRHRCDEQHQPSTYRNTEHPPGRYNASDHRPVRPTACRPTEAGAPALARFWPSAQPRRWIAPPEPALNRHRSAFGRGHSVWIGRSECGLELSGVLVDDLGELGDSVKGAIFAPPELAKTGKIKRRHTATARNRQRGDPVGTSAHSVAHTEPAGTRRRPRTARG